MSHIKSCAATDVGLQRTNNEDAYLDSPENGLWIVADGMGGHAAGEVASSIATQVIREKCTNGSNIIDAIQSSHHAVLDAAANGLGGRGMGSTVVVLKAKKGAYEIGWVGDSRAYKWSQDSEKRLTRLSKDHSYVQMLFESGLISEADMDNHPEKNIITQCLGSVELENVNVSAASGEWKNKDILLLCSDGLTDGVNDAQIDQIISEADSIEVATANLVDAALAAGGKDNITVVLVEASLSFPANIIDRTQQLLSNALQKLF